MATLTAYPEQIRENASCIVVYQGNPNRSVSWNLTGSGSLVPFSSSTNETGLAGAKYVPGTPGDAITIEVTAGA